MQCLAYLRDSEGPLHEPNDQRADEAFPLFGVGRTLFPDLFAVAEEGGASGVELQRPPDDARPSLKAADGRGALRLRATGEPGAADGQERMEDQVPLLLDPLQQRMMLEPLWRTQIRVGFARIDANLVAPARQVTSQGDVVAGRRPNTELRARDAHFAVTAEDAVAPLGAGQQRGKLRRVEDGLYVVDDVERPTRHERRGDALAPGGVVFDLGQCARD